MDNWCNRKRSEFDLSFLSISKVRIPTLFILLLFSIVLQAQGKTQDQKDKMKRDKEIMSFISEDQEVLNYYNKGKYTLNAGRDFGVISVGFMSSFLFSNEYTNLGVIFINAIAASLSGTVGIALTISGKSKIRDVENYVRGEMGYGETKLNLGITDNGVGLVFHF